MADNRIYRTADGKIFNDLWLAANHSSILYFEKESGFSDYGGGFTYSDDNGETWQ